MLDAIIDDPGADPLDPDLNDELLDDRIFPAAKTAPQHPTPAASGRP